MAGGQERVLRRRIRSIKSTQKITRAMELIAASQIVRAQGRIAAARPYQEGMARIVVETALGDPAAAGRLLGTPDEVHTVAVLGHRGRPWALRRLQHQRPAGHRAADRRPGRGRRRRVPLVTVGKKAQATSASAARPSSSRSSASASGRPSTTPGDVAAAVIAPFVRGEVDQVLLVSTRFLSAGSQRSRCASCCRWSTPDAEPSRPRARAGSAGLAAHEDATSRLHRVRARRGHPARRPGAPGRRGRDLRRPARGLGLEHAARQRAMAAATDNADDLIKKSRGS